jgi:hypothetical protein
MNTPFLQTQVSDLKPLWLKGIYTPHGYLYHLILCQRRAGWWLGIENVKEFCQEWEISERQFYRAKAKLIAEGFLEEKIYGRVELRINLQSSLPEPLTNLSEPMTDLSVAMTDLSVAMTDLSEATLESPTPKGFPAPYRSNTDLNTDLIQIDRESNPQNPKNFNSEKLAEEEVNHPLTTIEPEIINPAKKAKSTKKGNLSAADFELFRQTWNTFKPQTFGEMRNVGPGREKIILRIVSEFGSFEAALDGLEAALAFARSDAWCQTVNLSFENVASNNKLIGWSERATAARPLEPSTAKRAVTTYNRLAALEDVEPITPRHLLNSNS